MCLHLTGLVVLLVFGQQMLLLLPVLLEPLKADQTPLHLLTALRSLRPGSTSFDARLKRSSVQPWYRVAFHTYWMPAPQKKSCWPILSSPFHILGAFRDVQELQETQELRGHFYLLPLASCWLRGHRCLQLPQPT